jgi:hypothetical protein
LAWVGERGGEFIIPEGRAKDYFRAAVGMGAGSFTRMPYDVMRDHLYKEGMRMREGSGDAATSGGGTARGLIQGPLFHVPVTVQGNAYPGIGAEIAVELERQLGPMLFDSGIIEKILNIKRKNRRPGA